MVIYMGSIAIWSTIYLSRIALSGAKLSPDAAEPSAPQASRYTFTTWWQVQSVADQGARHLSPGQAAHCRAGTHSLTASAQAAGLSPSANFRRVLAQRAKCLDLHATPSVQSLAPVAAAGLEHIQVRPQDLPHG